MHKEKGDCEQNPVCAKHPPFRGVTHRVGSLFKCKDLVEAWVRGLDTAPLPGNTFSEKTRAFYIMAEWKTSSMGPVCCGDSKQVVT